MSLETKTNLDDATIEGVQKLIRYNIDSADGFKESADGIKTESIATLFRDLATERRQLATELQTYVQLNGDEPVDSGSAMAAITSNLGQCPRHDQWRRTSSYSL